MNYLNDFKIIKSVSIKIFTIFLLGILIMPFTFGQYYQILFLLIFLFLFLFSKDIFIKKEIVFVYCLLLAYLSLYSFDKYNSDFRSIIANVGFIFLPVSLFRFFIYAKDKKSLSHIIYATYIFITIISLTSIIGLLQFPYATRALAGSLAAVGQTDLIMFYRARGIAEYGFFYGVSIAIPVFIASMFNSTKPKKLMIILMLIIFSIALILSQLMTAILFVPVGIISVLIIKKRRTIFLNLIFIILFLMIILFNQILASLVADFMIYFGSNMSGELDVVSSKIVDLGNILKYGTGSGGSASVRIDLSSFALSEAINTNFLGGGKSSGHAFWLDQLSMYGVFVIIPWVMIIGGQISYVSKKLRLNNKYPYYISMSLFVLMGFLKNMGGPVFYMIIFFVIPGTLLIKNDEFWINYNKKQARVY